MAGEARKAITDTDRINWMCKHTVSCCHHQLSEEQGDVFYRGNNYRGATLREAIDKAMAVPDRRKA